MKSTTNGNEDVSAVFQRIMDNMLGNLQPRCAVAYIDDITIFSRDIKTYLQDVDKILQQLSKSKYED